MQAVLLVGGKGTRMRDMFPGIPKPLIPISGRPFIEWQIEWLAGNGIADIHLAAGHKAFKFEEWLAAATIPNVRITLSVERKPLDTAGGLKWAERSIRGEAFLALNGDSLMPNLDPSELADRHAGNSGPVTMAVCPIKETGRYGTVEFGADGAVTAFNEKADRAEGWVNGGVYAMSRSVFEIIPGNTSRSLERDLFPALAGQGGIKAHRSPPPLLDMGTPEGLRAMEDYLASRSRHCASDRSLPGAGRSLKACT